jgi:predicted RNA-binding Zn-ribbon protein involved in translation (DUF1610 family)
VSPSLPEPAEDADLSSSKESSTSSGHNVNRQTVLYCPYCGEETLFPAERGWECRSCLRAFSVSFLGLVSRGRV